MKLIDLLATNIASDNSSYFIIDSGGHDGDIDFVDYSWQRSKNNKIKTGDFFIYRKPQSLSANGQFYLYGAGQFGEITGDDNVVGHLTNAYQFDEPLTKSDLEDFHWEWKTRGKTWEHFWGQYGINQITHNDFINLIGAVAGEDYDPIAEQQSIQFEAKIANGNFYVDDETATTKIRSWQRPWSLRIKDNYGYKCAICDVSTPSLLVGSHIVPSGKDQHNRMNPSNGICLCVLHDAVFDRGFITVDNEMKVIYSRKLIEDDQLNVLVRYNARQTLRQPKFDKVNPDFMEYHRLNVFQDNSAE